MATLQGEAVSRAAHPPRFGCPGGAVARISSANAALTVIEILPDLPPSIVMFNEMSHLRPDLKWTGFTKILCP